MASRNMSSRARPCSFFWSGNDTFDKKGTVRETPSPTHNAALNSLIQHLRRWRRCIIAGPGEAQCWGLNRRFDEIVEKYTDYLDDRSVP